MNSNSVFVRNCYKRCCLWGKKSVVRLQNPYEGGPTPLWMNPQKKFQIVFAIINFILLIVILITYLAMREEANKGDANKA